MVLKRKNYTPQEYLQVGMAFFLIGLFAAKVADVRMIGGFLTTLIPDKSWTDIIQGISEGFSIPIFCISIYFNLRGLYMFRQRL